MTTKLDLTQFEGHTRRIAYFSTDQKMLVAELLAQPNLAAGVWTDMREDRSDLLALAREQQQQIAKLREALRWIVNDADYKSPEAYAIPDITIRWVEQARAALKATEEK